MRATLWAPEGGELVVEGQQLAERTRTLFESRGIIVDEEPDPSTGVVYLFGPVFYSERLSREVSEATGLRFFGRQEASPLTGVGPRIFAVVSTSPDQTRALNEALNSHGSWPERLWTAYRALSGRIPGAIDREGIFAEIHDWSEWIEDAKAAENFEKRRARRWVNEYVGPKDQRPFQAGKETTMKDGAEPIS